MQKKWSVELAYSYTYKIFFGKEHKETSGYWPWSVMAETKEEAIKKAKEKWREVNPDYTDYTLHVGRIDNWDSWTVENAIKWLTGKEFAEWAKQQGLIKDTAWIYKFR